MYLEKANILLMKGTVIHAYISRHPTKMGYSLFIEDKVLSKNNKLSKDINEALCFDIEISLTNYLSLNLNEILKDEEINSLPENNEVMAKLNKRGKFLLEYEKRLEEFSEFLHSYKIPHSINKKLHSPWNETSEIRIRKDYFDYNHIKDTGFWKNSENLNFDISICTLSDENSEKKIEWKISLYQNDYKNSIESICDKSKFPHILEKIIDFEKHAQQKKD